MKIIKIDRLPQEYLTIPDYKWLNKAADAASEALWEMEGQKLGNGSRLGERQGPWLTHSLTHSVTNWVSQSVSACN